MRIIFVLTLLTACMFTMNGQVLLRPNGSFNLIVNDSTVADMFYVTGLYNDYTMEYNGTEIEVGGAFWSNACKRYVIDSIIAAPGSFSGVMKIRLSDPDEYGTPAGGIGAVMMETPGSTLPTTTANLSEPLQGCIQTHFAMKSDTSLLWSEGGNKIYRNGRVAVGDTTGTAMLKVTSGFPIDSILGPNMLINGGFTDTLNDWNPTNILWTAPGIVTTDDPGDGQGVINQTGLLFEEGKSYIIKLFLGAASDGFYYVYGDNYYIEIPGTGTEYTAVFTAEFGAVDYLEVSEDQNNMNLDSIYIGTLDFENDTIFSAINIEDSTVFSVHQDGHVFVKEAIAFSEDVLNGSVIVLGSDNKFSPGFVNKNWVNGFTSTNVLFGNAIGNIGESSSFTYNTTGNILQLGQPFANGQLRTTGFGSGSSASIEVGSGVGNRAITMSTYGLGATNRSNIAFNRFRTTTGFDSVAVQQNDELALLVFNGYDGAALQGSAALIATVDGVPALGSVPVGYNFATGTSLGTRTTRFRIPSGGGATVGSGTFTATPGVLNVDVGLRVANAATSGTYLRANGTNYVSSAIQAADIPLSATSKWTATGSEIYRNSKVRIGSTSTPAYDLDILSSSAIAGLRITSNSATNRPNILLQGFLNGSTIYDAKIISHTMSNTVTTIEAGYIGVVGEIVSAPGTNFVDYMYFGTETNGNSSNNTFRLYPNKTAYFEGPVGLGATAPVASAKLELVSTTQGVLFPRMTTAQKNAISSPATGLQLTDTDLDRPQYRTASAWKSIAFTDDIGSTDLGTITNGFIPKALNDTLVNSKIFETTNTVAVGTSTDIDAFSRFYVYGGTNGANLDVRPSKQFAGGYPQAIIDLQSKDFSDADSVGFGRSSFLVHYSGGAFGTTFGTSNVELGLLQFNGLGAAIKSFTPIQIGVGNNEAMRIDADNSVVINTPLRNRRNINAQVGTSYTLVLADEGKVITLANAGAITLTVPQNATTAFPVGSQIDLIQTGAGQVTVVGGGSAVVNGANGLKIRDQYAVITLLKIATDSWIIMGDTEP